MPITIKKIILIFYSVFIALHATANNDNFQGTIGRTNAESTPHWPEVPTPPENAPNVLIWLMDDVGFGHIASYGGLIETTTIDSIAANGLQFTDFHATPLCSPTRASLLAGRNPHSIGMGAHANTPAGYPGYNARIPKSAAGIAHILKNKGYATYAIGKWDHLPAEHVSPLGPFDYWPSGQGFEHFYGFLHYDANHFEPTLWQDHSPVLNPKGNNKNYHLTTDLADKAIDQIVQQHTINPNQPFFMYWSTGAVHAPHHAPKAYIEKYQGQFDMGWNTARKHILERQKKLGVVPADAQLPSWPEAVPKWDSLNKDQQRIAARAMEAFAGMLDHADDQFGRIIDTLKNTGQLDNTIIVILSDNGASAEGGIQGSFNETLMGQATWQNNIDHYDEWGSANTFPHYPVGWTAAGNTPFKYYKQSAFEGGNRVPMMISWGNNIKQTGTKRPQYHHVSDIVPSLLDMIGIEPPQTVNGIVQQPMDGMSFVYAINNAEAPNKKQVQYFELWGNHGIWADGWKANVQMRPKPWDVFSRPSLADAEWELYHVEKDFNERINIARQYPGKLVQMQQLFDREAQKYQVYPLMPDSWSDQKARQQQRLQARQGQFHYLHATERVPAALAPPLNTQPFTLVAKLNNNPKINNGVIFSFGGDDGGMALFLDKGKPVFAFNRQGLSTHYIRSNKKLPSDLSTVSLNITRSPNSTAGKVRLSINETTVANATIKVISATIPPHETFDVGIDLGSAVVPDYVQGVKIPAAFIDNISITIDLKP